MSESIAASVGTGRLGCKGPSPRSPDSLSLLAGSRLLPDADARSSGGRILIRKRISGPAAPFRWLHPRSHSHIGNGRRAGGHRPLVRGATVSRAAIARRARCHFQGPATRPNTAGPRLSSSCGAGRLCRRPRLEMFLCKQCEAAMADHYRQAQDRAPDAYQLTAGNKPGRASFPGPAAAGRSTAFPPVPPC